MGALTVPNGVWYPDQTDVGQPNVWAATMAQSVDAGIGVRLQKQEIAVGCKLSAASDTPLGATPVTIPMAVSDPTTGDFNNGMTLSGGVLTIQTKGMYAVSASLGLATNAAGTSRSGVNRLYKNTTLVSYAESPMSTNFAISILCNTVINCVPGDTIYMQGATGGGGVTGVTTNHAGYLNYLAVSMVQAVIS